MQHSQIQEAENVASWLLFGERVVSEGAKGWRKDSYGFRDGNIVFHELVSELIDGSIVPTDVEMFGFANG